MGAGRKAGRGGWVRVPRGTARNRGGEARGPGPGERSPERGAERGRVALDHPRPYHPPWCRRLAPTCTVNRVPASPASTSAPPSADVELIDVTKQFGTVTAVDHVSLRITPGAFYSLLGPSGCGKTTTLRMIAGFEQPTDGEILIAGEPAAGVPPYRRHVNTVFQHYALFPHMDVARNVGYGLRQVGVREEEERRRVDEALALVRLGGLGARRTWELSGGQQQRVALARALVNHPT